MTLPRPWVLVVVALAGPLSACPHRPPRLEPGMRLTTAEDLMSSMRERGVQLAACRMEGVITLRQEGKRIKARMTALAKRPAWLRFETQSFFDQPLSILTTDGMTFSLWDMEASRFLRGPATPANLSRVVPLLMDGPEVVGILLGDPPLIAFASSALSFDEGKGLYRLTLSNARETQTVWVHPQRLRPEEVEVQESPGGRRVYRLVFQDWSEAADRPPTPGRISFEMPAQGIELSLKVRETEVNPSLEERLFQMAPPPGVVMETVD